MTTTRTDYANLSPATLVRIYNDPTSNIRTRRAISTELRDRGMWTPGGR